MTVAVGVMVVVAGVVVGILSALFGIGGGLLMVPFITVALDESQHLAEGTSLLVIVPTAIAGVMAHRKSGFVSFRHALWLAVGGIGGAYVGALIALRLEGDTLRDIFALFLLAMATRLIWQGTQQVRTESKEAAP